MARKTPVLRTLIFNISLLLMLSVGAAFNARASSNVESSLSYGNTWGLHVQYQMDLRDNDVVINERLLSRSDSEQMSDLVAVALTSTGGEGKLSCHSGTYKHLIRRGDTVVIERGCMEEHRFGELFRAYSAIGKKR